VRTPQRFARAIGAGLFVGLVGLMLPDGAPAQGNPEKHPQLRKALQELHKARKQLQEAVHDFGGFRAEALRNTEVSIFLVDKALKFDKGGKGKGKGKTKGPILSDGFPTVPVAFNQGEKHPHMHRALVLLREAKGHLLKAAHDYGGFRVEAVRTIDVSIFLIEKGLQFDRK
jgi:hypothetical protein